ncbi:cytochrome c oxidase subunit 3 [Alkalimonas amylolytica]|uniref:Cytochrome c oxidase subunit 3 n=1 Tax=Alkalimonas amylolytica TaxID=152573 RepID=A0A1H4EM90_ALKAM|nr:cytochrome c oxidase subunit 3 [Alkalimonas amylolytica]
MNNEGYQKYYVPDQSPWPLVGAIALFFIALGAGFFVIDMSKDQSGWGAICSCSASQFYL